MPVSRARARPPRRLLPLKLLVPLLLGVVLTLVVLAFSELGFRRLETANQSMSASLQIQSSLHEVLSLVVDAETSQRGYLLTGQPEYLDPYRAALPKIEERFQRLRELMAYNASQEQRDRISRFNTLIGKRLNELEASIALYDKAGRDAAFELVNTGIGQRTMDQIRSEVAAIGEAHAKVVDGHRARWDHDVVIARYGMQAITLFTVVLLLVVWGLLQRDIRQREEARRLLVIERERLEAEVDGRTGELSELSNHLQMVREEEKTRLARDIHDELGGVLVSAKMDVAWAEERLREADGEAATKLRRALESLDAGVALKRRIIEELRPSLLDNLGLGPALEWLAHETCDRAGITLGTNVPSDSDAPPLPPHIAIALYRIVQEALTNVLKYAKAQKVDLELVQAVDSVSLVISDDGVGIPAEAKTHRLSHGISGMRQRVRALGGEFNIHSTVGRGTMIEVTVPLPQPDGVHEVEPPAGTARAA